MRRPNHASRFEGIAKTNLQASRASDTETLQSQVNKAAKKRLSLSGLEILHGRRCNRNGSRQAIRGPGGGQDWDGDSGVGSASVHSHDERPDPPTEDSGPGLAATPQVAGGRHDRLTNARLAAWFGTHRCERKPGRAGTFLSLAAASSSRMPSWRASRVGHSRSLSQ